jgi:hypothetical protein
VVTTTWVDARCGDGRCEEPFEFPEYGRFGCKADCDLLTTKAKITKIQIDIYYNFSHPKVGISKYCSPRSSTHICLIRVVSMV